MAVGDARKQILVLKTLKTVMKRRKKKREEKRRGEKQRNERYNDAEDDHGIVKNFCLSFM